MVCYLCSLGQCLGLAGIDPAEAVGGFYAPYAACGGMLPVEIGDGEHLIAPLQ